MNKESSIINKIFHKNGRAFGSMGYFIILMLIFLIGAPEAWLRPNLHQSVFVMMPTLIFLVIPLVFLVASGEIDLSFASTYALAAYIFAILVKSGIDPALAILAGVISGALVGAMVGALIVYGRLSSLVASLGVLFLLRGLILVLTKSRSITMMDELENHWVYHLLVGNLYGFPMQMVWALAFVIFSDYLFNVSNYEVPIENIRKLRFQFRFHDGRLVDFKNSNFNFTLGFNCIKDEIPKDYDLRIPASFG